MTTTATTADAMSMLTSIERYLAATIESAHRLDESDFRGLIDHYTRAAVVEGLGYAIRGNLSCGELGTWYARAAELSDEARARLVAVAAAKAHLEFTRQHISGYAASVMSEIEQALDK